MSTRNDLTRARTERSRAWLALSKLGEGADPTKRAKARARYDQAVKALQEAEGRLNLNELPDSSDVPCGYDNMRGDGSHHDY
jgi:hypothetical protein